MKIFKRILTVMCIVIANQAFCNDLQNPNDEAKVDLQENRNIYTLLTGLKPDEKNLLKTIETNPSKTSDTVAALEVLMSDTNQPENTIVSVIKCYQHNSSWLVQATCIKALIKLDEKKGIEFAKEFINAPKSDLEGKLLVASMLVSKKQLAGYPVIEDGLSSGNEYQKKLALRLLDAFRPYDRKAWNKSGDKIDISLMEQNGKWKEKGAMNREKDDGMQRNLAK